MYAGWVTTVCCKPIYYLLSCVVVSLRQAAGRIHCEANRRLDKTPR